MTELLEQAISRLKCLPDNEQDAISAERNSEGTAAIILAELEDEAQWDAAIYSARISKNYRAVGQLEGDTVIWFWIGSHAECDRLLSQF